MDGTVIFDVKEEGERERTTWRSLIRRRQPFSFCRFRPILSFCCLCFVVLLFLSCRLAMFLLFVVLSNRSFLFCRSVILFRRFAFPFRRFPLKRNKRATGRSLICAK